MPKPVSPLIYLALYSYNFVDISSQRETVFDVKDICIFRENPNYDLEKADPGRFLV
jgi:hypothetical protein